METILALVGGLGIGSVLTSVVQGIIAHRTSSADRLYSEKREAYVGLLNALHEAAISPSDANSKAYALWQTRCELFGSPAVASHAQAIVDTNDGPRSARNVAFTALVAAMRADLRR